MAEIDIKSSEEVRSVGKGTIESKSQANASKGIRINSEKAKAEMKAGYK